MNERKRLLVKHSRYECLEDYGPFKKGAIYSIESLMNEMDNTLLMMDSNRNLTYLSAIVLDEKFRQV